MKTISDVKLKYLIQKIKDLLKGKSDTDHTHLYAGSNTTGGPAKSATKLSTPRNFRVDLESNALSSFDGSGDVTPGVTGVLPASNGGTGYVDPTSFLAKYNTPFCVTGTYKGTGSVSHTIKPNTSLNAYRGFFVPMLLAIQVEGYRLDSGLNDHSRSVVVVRGARTKGDNGRTNPDVLTFKDSTRTAYTEFDFGTDYISSAVYIQGPEQDDLNDEEKAAAAFNKNGAIYHYFMIGTENWINSEYDEANRFDDSF